MDNNNIMQNSIYIFIAVFLIVVVFAYFYEQQKNKDDTSYKFDWTRYTLIGLISASASALLTSCMTKYTKKDIMKFGMGGCGACSMTGKNEMNMKSLTCGSS